MKMQIYRIAVLIKCAVVLIVLCLVVDNKNLNSKYIDIDSESAESAIAGMHNLNTKGMDKDSIDHISIRYRQILNKYEKCNAKREILNTSIDTCEKP